MKKAIKDLIHIQATHHGAVMAPCFHATPPFLMPSGLC